jgi:hypothetical protein
MAIPRSVKTAEIQAVTSNNNSDVSAGFDGYVFDKAT